MRAFHELRDYGTDAKMHHQLGDDQDGQRDQEADVRLDVVEERNPYRAAQRMARERRQQQQRQPCDAGDDQHPPAQQLQRRLRTGAPAGTTGTAARRAPARSPAAPARSRTGKSLDFHRYEFCFHGCLFHADRHLDDLAGEGVVALLVVGGHVRLAVQPHVRAFVRGERERLGLRDLCLRRPSCRRRSGSTCRPCPAWPHPG